MENIDQETWKDIFDYEELYQVSNRGRVRSYNRTHIQKNGRLRTIRGKDKVLQKNIDGYNVTSLYKDSKLSVKRVAVLVLQAFIGLRPSKEHVAMHLDNDKSNDNLSNLKWGTHSENVQHSVRSNTHFTPNYWAKQLGAKHPNSRIILQKNKQGEIINRFHGAGEAHRQTGISKYAISQNAMGKSRVTKSGFIFTYE